MKKIILTGVALVAFAAAGFAQNTATYTGVGTNQTNLQKQSGNKLTSAVKQGTGSNVTVNQGNNAYTDQSGKRQNATIEQNDTRSSRAAILQTTGGATANDATILQNQSGTGNFEVTDISDKAAVRAAGGNFGGVLQDGSGNKAVVDQSGTSNASTGNQGEIYQYGTNNNTGYNGLDNSAVGIFQDGTNNTATITQGTSGQPVTGNAATIEQFESASSNEATIKQLSDNNKAYAGQAFYAIGNTATVTQSGGSQGSTALVSQGGTSAANNASGNEATITQTDELNNAVIKQEGASAGNSQDNKATIAQDGTNNQAEIDQQDNSLSNTATINQTGKNNSGTGSSVNGSFAGGATISQGSNARANTATITESGDGNGAYIVQQNNSHDNVATIDQKGTSSYAEIFQNKEVANNTATVNQGTSGTKNYASVTQQYAYDLSVPNATGQNGNSVEVNQNVNSAGGNNKAVVLQGGDAANITDKSKVTVTQEDNLNQAYLTQTGQKLTAKVDQDGNYNLLTKGGATDNALQLGSNYTLTVTQSAPGATAGFSNSAFVNSNNVGGGGITITQTLVP